MVAKGVARGEVIGFAGTVHAALLGAARWLMDGGSGTLRPGVGVTRDPAAAVDAGERH